MGPGRSTTDFPSATAIISGRPGTAAIMVHDGAALFDHAHVEILFTDGGAPVDDHGVGNGERLLESALEFGGIVVDDGEHDRFGSELDEHMLDHETVRVDVLATARFGACGDGSLPVGMNAMRGCGERAPWWRRPWRARRDRSGELTAPALSSRFPL